MNTHKLVRITTVPISLKYLIQGQMHFMSENGFEVTMISADGKEVQDVIANEKCRHIIIHLTRKITPIQDLKAVIKLYKFLKKQQPLIVHTHTPKAGIVGMLAAKIAGVPIRLHTVAGLPLLEAKGLKRKLLNFVEKTTYWAATKVYPNSFGLKEIILDHKFTGKNKLKVLANGSSNGINTAYFNPNHFSKDANAQLRNELHIQPTDFVFIFIGRLVSDKGINELVATFCKLQSNQLPNAMTSKSETRLQDCKTARLLLVGPLETDLDPLNKETLKEIEYNQSIISVGYQEDVRPYFAISDVLVFPSYREGFPNVVMQAGAMGLPSIVTNINGCNEIIKEGENGWIVPVKDSNALNAAMENCVIQNNSFDLIKGKARKMIKDRYEQKVVWEAILAEYKSLENRVKY